MPCPTPIGRQRPLGLTNVHASPVRPNIAWLTSSSDIISAIAVLHFFDRWLALQKSLISKYVRGQCVTSSSINLQNAKITKPVLCKRAFEKHLSVRQTESECKRGQRDSDWIISYRRAQYEAAVPDVSTP